MTDLPLCDRLPRVETVEKVSHDFGFRDRFRRSIGCFVTTYVADVVALPEGAVYGYRMKPGVYFVLCTSATRGGETYGASQSDRYFETDAERDAVLAKYLKTAAKAAEKRAGK